MNLNEIQIELEKDAVEVARQRYRESVAHTPLSDLPPGQQLVRRSMDAVVAAIQDWQEQAHNGTAGRLVGLAKFLAQFDAEEVAFVALRTAVQALANEPAKLTAVATVLTRSLESIDLAERLRKANPATYERYLRFAKRPRYTAEDSNYRLAILRKQFQYTGKFGADASFAWTDRERLQVGVRLLEIVADVTGMIEFDVVHKVGDAHPSRVIRPTEATREWIQHAHSVCEILRPAHLPMVVPPKDWQGSRGGGYLTATGADARLMKAAAGGYREELETADLSEVTAAINAIQKTRWKVNRRVLAVVQEARRRGLSIGSLPANALVLDEPPVPHDALDKPEKDRTEEDTERIRQWGRERRRIQRMRSIQASRTTALDICLDTAERMKDFEAIYFPHQIDFRGRAYPMTVGLHPQGNDVSKGLLLFADGVPLGEDGMQWLAIHGANSFGVDKVPFADRVAWVKDHFHEILADVEDPFRDGALWQQADSPWQFLAFCYEWADLCEWEGDKRDFPSCLPVSLDGSCNGLQHFSAMLRDERGAAATNLIPSDRPQDIYAKVAVETNKRLQMDLASDDPLTRKLAQFWINVGVDRKWTKRNTMTLPYGVTPRGMVDQLWKEISDEDHSEFFGDLEERGAAVRYLAALNWEATAAVVTAARQAMDWLQHAARLMSKVKVEGMKGVGLPINWDTPDGLPVQQRYMRRDTIQVKLFGAKVVLTLRPHTDKLDARRQIAALAPNFVHSLDAAHMRAVVRELVKRGVRAFAMVHDSFGTHAGHCTILAEVTRQEFVKLHSVNRLAEFAEYVRSVLPEEDLAELPPLPPVGTLDLEVVKRSPYFFA